MGVRRVGEMEEGRSLEASMSRYSSRSSSVRLGCLRGLPDGRGLQLSREDADIIKLALFQPRRFRPSEVGNLVPQFFKLRLNVSRRGFEMTMGLDQNGSWANAQAREDRLLRP